MKKHLLLGIALMAAVSAFPQNGRIKAQPSKIDISKDMAIRREKMNSPEKASSGQTPIMLTRPIKNVGAARSSATSAASTFSINWTPISGSMNIYGVLEETSKSIQYNDELNSVSFIHRKSATYQPNPAPSPTEAATGAIVDLVTQDWGLNWDSTCLWNNNAKFARYPQGGIYSAPNNTNMANTYAIATGPITQINTTLGWIGSYLASKQLDTTHGLLYDNVASTVSNAQQFIANTQPYGPTGKFDYPSFDFTTTDDGVVRSLGQIVNDFNSVAVGPSGRGFRGARILKGSLSAGVFNWVGDSVPLTAVTVTNNAGDLSIIGIPHMCWNESGTIGFVWFIGQRIGATGSNRGFQTNRL